MAHTASIKHLFIPVADNFSDHFCEPDNDQLQKRIDLVESADRVYMVGEYDWTGNNKEPNTLEDFVSCL